MNNLKVYRAYHDMMQRCYNANNPRYPLYGGRGIKVCDEWRGNVDGFYAYIGDAPSGKHSLDRIDVNGDYRPGNVRWATQYEQVNNRRNNVLISYGGKTQTLKQWADELGVNYDAFISRRKLGWTDAEIIATPVKAYRKR